MRTEEILALARDMYTNGTMNDVTYCKITMRDVPKADAAALASPTSVEIRLRQQAYMSQTVFARYLNLPLAMCRSWNGAQSRPTGSALALPWY